MTLMTDECFSLEYWLHIYGIEHGRQGWYMSIAMAYHEALGDYIF